MTRKKKTEPSPEAVAQEAFAKAHREVGRLRDGQTVLFGTGTGKISGEVLKIEVTLHVVK